MEILEEFQMDIIVPPLETDLPLSYRTGQSEITNREVVGSTATTIEGLIYKNATPNQESGYSINLKNFICAIKNIFSPPSTSFKSKDCDAGFNYLIQPLKWVNLIEPDRHVLQSIENSLIRPSEPSALLHCCDFFSNILLHDFPSEVFLQRPTIVKVFLFYLIFIDY